MGTIFKNGIQYAGGGGSSVTVDQTYDATSENAQSGKAVAEAVSGVGGSGFVAEYQVTTAQEIIEYLDGGGTSPIVIKRGDDYYTTIMSQKVNDTRVALRAFGTLSGSYYVFTYTITDGTWASAIQGLQNLLVSGTNIKTVNTQSLLGSGDITV